MTMTVLVDIGNSRLKWGSASAFSIKSGAPIAHRADAFEVELETVWQNVQPSPTRVAVSCVAAESVADTARSIAAKLWPHAEWIRAVSEASACGVVNGYRFPKQLGVDRWLSLIGARRLRPDTVVCIVDCGTAVTVDVVAADGRHLGGLIAPGLTLMKQTLSKNTVALPFNNNVYPVGLAETTEAGIFNGTLFAVVGLIRSVMERLNEKPALILTGGDAVLIAEHLNLDCSVEPDLVLYGLVCKLGV
ncbi:MAG: type III pantothenate kinase [Gammaproteobacteria bacterium]